MVVRAPGLRLALLGATVVVAACGSGESAPPSRRSDPGFYETRFAPVAFEAGNRELERLRKRFGAKHYSWHYEEWFIRDYFDDQRDGFFVDVGAWLYSSSSNTFLLESELGWRGIAIDAQERYRKGYEEHRPRTKYFTYFVSDQSSGSTKLYVPAANPAVASSSSEFVKQHNLDISETLEVPQITLDELLTREGVERIDFLSMDIELAEPAALRGFDIKRFAPRLVCIEEHPDVREFIEKYFESNGYAKLELWSRIDSYNAYFGPAKLVADFERRRGHRE